MSTDLEAQMVEIDALGGRVRGLVEAGVRTFHGIRYASPPVGPLRWQPPRLVETYEALIEATEFGADCPQAPLNPGFQGTRATRQSEDCLFLNIWSPADAENLPVMVWIHGGGFTGGSGSNVTYDGRGLAALGVVLVTINYRCGVFGFLSHPELAGPNPRGVSSNYGLLDQLAALQWVRERIADFGGDPANVTAFGESAGGTSINYLLTSPLAHGLIDKAILQSPGPMRGLMSHAEASEKGAALGRLQALRAMSEAELLALTDRLVPDFRRVVGPRALGPIRDGWVLPHEDWEAYAQGEVLAVPLLLGCNGDEGEIIARRRPLTTVPRYLAYMQDNFGARTDEALEHYAVGSASGIGPAVSRLFGDTQFVYGTRGIARASAERQAKTYLYWFDPKRGGQTASPTHGEELPYVFGTLDAPFDGQASPYRPEDRALSSMMMRAWTQFARTGTPDIEDQDWPPVGGEDRCVCLQERIELGRFPRAAALDFLATALGPSTATAAASAGA